MIKSDILDLMKQNKKEFYTPKEFHKKTGLAYRTVLHYCSIGKIKAVQRIVGGSWLIYHSELERFINDAKFN